MTLKELLSIDTSNAAAYEERDRQIEATEQRLRAQKKQADYEKLVPARYWGASFQSYKVDTREQFEIKEKVTALVDTWKKYKGAGVLVILGPSGTGKTHLACSAIRELGGAFSNACEIVDELRRVKAFSSKESEADRLKRYASYNLLVIDEVGRGARESDEVYALYQVINARYNAQKPLILCSNLKRDAFLNYIGTAAQDRLIENGYIFEFSDLAESYRKKIRGTK